MDLFKKRAPSGRGRLVKGWVTAQLGLSEADLVTVAELACHEPGCPPVETVVTVHGADGARRDWRVHKPVAEIEEADVVRLFAEQDRQT